MTISGQRLGEAVVDIGTQGMQRNLTLTILLLTRHFRAGKATGTHDANTSHSELHCAQNRLPHGALVGNTFFDLLGDGFGNQLRIDVWVPDLLHADMDLLFGQLLQFESQIIHSLTATPDNNAGFGRM